ncbi:tubulin polyglutamylase TTLL4-like protein [Euroglyphus maynei]|uniref:Tubulin polyglutamylase TTLL4-like protein n=1 Tax=Euroglyphus maynei TaxID=6958 RepID=A0A1Y3BM80_EURMA|nr:tubulin polyglutamylase TTLL4-like protein [Euroglyphus maynei]
MSNITIWILLPTIIAILLFYTIRIHRLQYEQQTSINTIIDSLNRRDVDGHKPLAWIYGENVCKFKCCIIICINMQVGYLHHVIDIFQKIGFRIWTRREPPPIEEYGDWHVLWSHEYPFTSSFNLPQLKPFQKVNHFPGSGFITNKVNLATSGLKHIPKAFTLPGEKESFINFTKENPDKLWVQKDNNHRGIRVLSIDQLDLNRKGTFVQEFIQNPLLIDGKKFDIGLYVTMTSLNPLRIYIYDNEALLRFCARPYTTNNDNSFNASDIDSYVVGDHYTPIWEIPSLDHYYTDLNMNMKSSLNAYIRLKLDRDPQPIWTSMEESIKTIFYMKEEEMLRLANVYPNMRNFFELVRFDFTIDDQLNVFLMEANMSPNLASAKYPPNRIIYEQVIYSCLSLVGITRMPLTFGTWPNKPEQLWNPYVHHKDLSILPDICSDEQCDRKNLTSCQHEQCDVCYHCITAEMHTILMDAYMEEMSRYHNNRLIPSTSKESPLTMLGPNTYLQDKWFIGKCLSNDRWCN